eukprot:2215437-Pyramimonas_sp.AAC.1
MLIAGVASGPLLVARDDGVFMYRQGALQLIEEFSATDVRRLELALLEATAMFKVIMGDIANKGATAAFDAMLPLARETSTLVPIIWIDTQEFRGAKLAEFSEWAMGAFKHMSAVATRFVGRSSSGSLVEMVGAWKQEERPEQPSTVVVFEDAC